MLGKILITYLFLMSGLSSAETTSMSSYFKEIKEIKEIKATKTLGDLVVETQNSGWDQVLEDFKDEITRCGFSEYGPLCRHSRFTNLDPSHTIFFTEPLPYEKPFGQHYIQKQTLEHKSKRRLEFHVHIFENIHPSKSHVDKRIESASLHTIKNGFFHPSKKIATITIPSNIADFSKKVLECKNEIQKAKIVTYYVRFFDKLNQLKPKEEQKNSKYAKNIKWLLEEFSDLISKQQNEDEQYRWLAYAHQYFNLLDSEFSNILNIYAQSPYSEVKFFAKLIAIQYGKLVYEEDRMINLMKAKKSQSQLLILSILDGKNDLSPNIISLVRPMTKSTHNNVVTAAVRLLKKNNAPDDFGDELIRTFDQPLDTFEARMNWVSLLRNVHTENSTNNLLPMLFDEDPLIRSFAMDAFNRFDKRILKHSHISQLKQLMKAPSKEAFIQFDVALIFCKYDNAFLDFIIDLSLRENKNLWIFSLTLPPFTPTQIDKLIHYIKSETNVFNRITVVKGVAKNEGTDVTRFLKECLQDSDDDVKALAETALL